MASFAAARARRRRSRPRRESPRPASPRRQAASAARASRTRTSSWSDRATRSASSERPGANGAELKGPAAREDPLEVELKATLDASAKQLNKSHDARLALQKERHAYLESSYAELRQAEALLAETLEAFTDYTAKKQIALTRPTVALE